MITIIITTIIAYLLITYGSFNTTKCAEDIVGKAGYTCGYVQEVWKKHQKRD